MPDSQTTLTDEQEAFLERAHTGNRIEQLMEQARDNPDSMARKVALDLKEVRDQALFSHAGIDYYPAEQVFEVSNGRWSWTLTEDRLSNFREIGFRIVATGSEQTRFKHKQMVDDAE